MKKTDITDYTESFTDNLSSIYRGVIEDNNDPKKIGRCKIRVFGIHTPNKNKTNIDGIPTEELPWSDPALGLFEGSVSGFGAWTIPLQGSHVFVFFEGGNILQPRYFATCPSNPTDQNHGFSDKQGFSDPDKEYPNKETKFPHKPNQLNESDFHRLSRNEGIDETIVEYKKTNKDKGVPTADGNTWDEPDPYYSAKYPKNKVFSTSSGITIELDDTENEERIHLYHPSKTYIEIDKEGNIIIRNSNDKYEIVDNNKKEHIQNNYDRTTNSNRTNKVGENENENIGNNKTVNIGGNYTVNITGTTFIESKGTTTVNGLEVFLNDGTGRIVTTNHICQVTGLPHNHGSSTCYAEK